MPSTPNYDETVGTVMAKYLADAKALQAKNKKLALYKALNKVLLPIYQAGEKDYFNALRKSKGTGDIYTVGDLIEPDIAIADGLEKNIPKKYMASYKDSKARADAIRNHIEPFVEAYQEAPVDEKTLDAKTGPVVGDVYVTHVPSAVYRAFKTMREYGKLGLPMPKIVSTKQYDANIRDADRILQKVYGG